MSVKKPQKSARKRWGVSKDPLDDFDDFDFGTTPSKPKATNRGVIPAIAGAAPKQSNKENDDDDFLS